MASIYLSRMIFVGLVARIVAVLIPIVVLIFLVGGSHHIDLALAAGLLVFGGAAFLIVGSRRRGDLDVDA